MGYQPQQAIHGLPAILRVVWKQHGIRAPFILGRQAARYLLARFAPGKKVFTLDGRPFPYCLDAHNQAFANERTVEVPLALNLFPLQGNILEIGNVLSQYARFERTIIDKYEVDANVLNLDIVDYAPATKFDLILSLSTFEHIGFDEEPKDPGKVDAAITIAKGLLKPGGKFLMTIPIGWNTGLDQKLKRFNFTSLRYLKRVSAANAWVETSEEEALKRKYGEPFPAANAVVICLYET